MSKVPVSCRGCGDPCVPGPRCARCAAEYEAIRNAKPSRRQYRDPVYRSMRPVGLCWICGKPGTPDDPLTRDHLVPVSKGGTVYDGIRPAHRSCNSARGNRGG